MSSIPISPDPTSSDTDSTTSTSPPTPQTPSEEEQEEAKFPLAHPPPKPTQRLRLAPKLLLQIQHLAPNSTRPLPVLEVWLPARFAGRLSPSLPKLSGGDMYITQSESYTSLSGESHNAVSDAGASHEEAAAAVVGVIYRAHAQKTKLKKEKQKQEQEPAQGCDKAEVRFPLGGRAWTGSVTAGGGYRFQGDGDGKHVLEWRRRGTGNCRSERRRASGSSSSTDPAPTPGGDRMRSRFVLVVVDVKTRRGARVASLTKRGFEVGGWEGLPRDALRECVGVGVGVASSTEAEAEAGELSDAQLRTAVYTMILTMGVWVASQEGWLG